MYFSRVACIKGGLPQETTALTVNRLCGSGMQAIVSAAQGIMLGDCDAAVGGGAESMSRGGYLLPNLRWGQRMNDSGAIDMMVGAVTDPFEAVHMGITAENIAAQWKITREQQDEFSVESHRRAINAIDKGHFKDQILPIELKTRKGTTLFERDEHPRADVTLEGLAKLRAAFKKEGGSVTAGNASGINDGAAFFVLAAADVAAKAGFKPMARLVSYAVAGVPNDIMGEGPIPATRLALKKAGMTLDQMDVIESNEAFAAQALSVAKVLGLDPAKTNPNGGAIALGHPVGCSGAFIATKALYELERVGGKYCLVTMCIGGGQGIAAIFERA
jgi:acetyl-CoA C-acetyltransferase